MVPVQDSHLADETANDGTIQVGLRNILPPIWAARKRILVISLAVCVVTYLVNFFLLTPYFKSTATLLPETEKSKLLSLSQFSDVAQKILGENIPGSEIARLYPVVVTSETILRSVIARKYAIRSSSDSIDLIEYLEIEEDTPAENMAMAIRSLKNLMTASIDARTGIVTVSVEMPEPQLAADVLNAIVAELDDFMRRKRVTTASEQVKWIDVRMKEIEEELSAAEDSLKRFREANRRVLDSPQLLLRQERLLRDVSVKSIVFVELKKQYELAKLEEIKNISIVNILDPGRAPVRKERPTRLANSALMFVLSIVIACTYYGTRSTFLSRVRELFEPRA